MPRKNEIRKVVYIFLIYKILIISIAYAAYLIPEEFTNRKHSDTTLLDPFAQLDARAYLDIAKNGYNAEFNGTTNYGWYPLYPLLIRMFSFIGFELAAFLLANIFSFIAVYLLYVIVKDEFDKHTANKSIFYLLFFPTAFFLTMMYTESLFLSLTLAMFLLARREKWHYVGLLGFMASLTRAQGIILLLPMAYIYAKKRRFKISNIDKNILFLLLIVAGLLTLYGYYYITTGDPFIHHKTSYLKYQRGFSMPWESFLNTFNEISRSTSYSEIFVDGLNMFIFATVLGLGYVSLKYLKKEYSIYIFASIVFPLFSGSLASMTRFVLLVFPVFMTLAIMSKNKSNRRIINMVYVVSIALLVMSTIYYANEEISPEIFSF